MEIVIGDLPSCQADPALLKQVWTNLLSNALKYTRKRAYRADRDWLPHGAVATSGSTLAPRRARHREVVYFVKDNGAGFDMKYAKKLFGVFQRLHRAADYEGTGVGLAIVQRIVNVTAAGSGPRRKLNQGATFSFTLA